MSREPCRTTCATTYLEVEAFERGDVRVERPEVRSVAHQLDLFGRDGGDEHLGRRLHGHGLLLENRRRGGGLVALLADLLDVGGARLRSLRRSLLLVAFRQDLLGHVASSFWAFARFDRALLRPQSWEQTGFWPAERTIMKLSKVEKPLKLAFKSAKKVRLEGVKLAKIVGFVNLPALRVR